ncbi:thiamine diphosphokinase [Clostridium neuense]|uniref:Thiamine diphosphokinase n=1 Tax=Clostridium neuense TaxID=1728934 RepID=A0ABW8TCJ1_9CLOT
MKVVVISGGKEPSKELLMKEIKNCDFLICADSGANCLHKYNIRPNILLGDFDSIAIEAFEYYKNNCVNVLKYPKEKDFTDTELALSEALKLDVTEVVFLGCTGTRLDHLFGNMGLLLRCVKKGIKACIKDDNNTIFIIDKTCILSGEKGEMFSIQAYMNEVENLSIEGAKYPLKNYNLKFGDPRTISNEFLDGSVKISFEEGYVIVFKSRD